MGSTLKNGAGFSTLDVDPHLIQSFISREKGALGNIQKTFPVFIFQSSIVLFWGLFINASLIKMCLSLVPVFSSILTSVDQK